ncbi:MaoC/PaaZ C-terminal domain-containing protein [Streptomyces sp. O3]
MEIPVFGPRGDRTDGGGGGGGSGGHDRGRGRGRGRGVVPVRVGDELPPLTVPVTRLLIVSGAIASRDYQDVHHDAVAAAEKGSPDIFMNILTTNGLVGRYVTDHFGPGAVLRKMAIRLGAPNYPGDTMVLTGTVVRVDGGAAQVKVTGANGIGQHVTGTVTVTVDTGEGMAAGA